MSSDETKRELVLGRPDLTLCDNRVSTSKYTLLTFIPIAVKEQFRRNGNVYFLCMGILMAVGYYSSYFQTAISPWTTLGPLAVVMSISLAQEGVSDLARHRADNRTNQHPCVVLNRAEVVDSSGGNRDDKIFDGEDLTVRLKKGHAGGASASASADSTPSSIPSGGGVAQIAFERVKRMNIRAGHLVFVRNRDMVPADLVVLASSGDAGSAYIETSSIDGETNLKLRASPTIPRNRNDLESTREMTGTSGAMDPAHVAELETLEQAVKRIARMSALTKPDGQSAVLNPMNPSDDDAAGNADLDDLSVATGEEGGGWGVGRRPTLAMRASSIMSAGVGAARSRATSTMAGAGGGGAENAESAGYVAALTSEPPNASVNTYSGKLTMAPFGEGSPGSTIALGADNILLRGAILRNTEWAIGVACFTGKDTKLVMNSFQTPSKFSGLDEAINRTVWLILFLMLVIVLFLSGLSTNAYAANFDELWYCGYSDDLTKKWPYFLPVDGVELPPPEWEEATPKFGQQVFLFITLLNNFVPLSLYVTVEVCTMFMMGWIGTDQDIYHAGTDTRALARSTTVSDLGQVKYIFSDKTGTLTQNVMRFKRCSVDGMAFGAPVEKSAPGAAAADKSDEAATGGGAGGKALNKENVENIASGAFHPLRQLLLGAVDGGGAPKAAKGTGNLGEGESLDENGRGAGAAGPKKLTFDAEMFLRVMSICHTVVVEKDFDVVVEKDDDDGSVSSKNSGFFTTAAKKLKITGRTHKRGGSSDLRSRHGSQQQLDTVSESGELKNGGGGPISPGSLASQAPYDHAPSSLSEDGGMAREGPSSGAATFTGKSNDGAPFGCNYQAESPDEGALVSAASLTYGFQFIGRDSQGVKLACASPSLLADKEVADGLKSKKVSPRTLSAETASPVLTGGSLTEGDWDGADSGSNVPPSEISGGEGIRYETWDVLAVNKFDSDRKRMSVLVRSPPEFGSIPMLLCKGADSAMLDSKVCTAGKHLMATTDGNGDGGAGEARDQPQATRPLSGNNALSMVNEDISASGQEILLAATRSKDREARDREEDEWEMAAMLGIQAHLGDFASEGLRTLVLGVRILTERETESWLKSYAAAASSINNRDEKLTEVALEIERDLHIVGATAIEDKLQDGVPETIATLGEAGIRLWVLTGDKRETAIEIGYSTKVLTPKMHLTQVADGPVRRVKTLMAMEFVRLVKCGKLPDYHHSVLEAPPKVILSPLKWKKSLAECWRSWLRLKLGVRMWWFRLKGRICCRGQDEHAEQTLKEMLETMRQDPAVRRKAVRVLADEIIAEYMESDDGRAERSRRLKKRDSVPEQPYQNEEGGGEGAAAGAGDDFGDEGDDDLAMSSDELPTVFNRAQSARAAIDTQMVAGQLGGSTLRSLSIAAVTSRESSAALDIIDEDMLSLVSFLPDGGVGFEDFDKKKRTVLEKLFAVDKHVRHGHLGKHLNREKRAQLADGTKGGGAADGGAVNRESLLTLDIRNRGSQVLVDSGLQGPRALVIEGAALVHLLGDPELEEMLFAVASACDAVIACRVSPKQKALLVRLVRKYVSPTPVTLAIGDGANDVGMIQEAHVGIGVSGLEGQQAVNASDFSIAQFRFLRDLLLIHGRWNFIRLSKIALFSFYKNALMAGTMIVFQRQNLYSGTPLYDPWVVSSLNFVAGWPILFTGLFDRDLEKDYVRRNPIVYASGPNNENITLRITMRWILICVIHMFTIYYFAAPALANGGGNTSAFAGLMGNEDPNVPGDGEGGDMKVFGTTIYACLIFTLAYKVFFETRSIVNGEWPAFTCRRGVGEGWANRLAYTWIGTWWLSIGFTFFFFYTYSLIGRNGVSSFSTFVMVAMHTFNARAITWMVILLVPVTACVFDVTGKLFSNLYYPTQTQIHMEIQAKEVAAAKRQRGARLGLCSPSLRKQHATSDVVEPV